MSSLLIKNAKQVDHTNVEPLIDILIIKGKIIQIGNFLNTTQVNKTIDLKGQYYVSAGWIDAHTHCFPASPIYHDEPDLAGILTGVTTVVDAGSVGADDMDAFNGFAIKAKTNVFAFINISKIGLAVQHELADMSNISDKALLEAYQKYPEFIVGLKARISSSVVGDNGIKPLYRAKEMQRMLAQSNNMYKLPLMVHIGNSPPDLDEIADLLDQGDIITHCFNGKPNKILDETGQIKASVKRAIKRGVILDVGHGGASFSFAVAEHSVNELGLYPDTISSDIYYRNRINGPVYSLATVMTKFLAIGFSLSRIIQSVTSKPADMLHLTQKGHLKPNYDADLTIFELKNASIELIDAEKVTKIGTQHIIAVATVVAGEWTLTTDGEHYHDFKQ